MTRATVQGYINRAMAAVEDGDCEAAEEHVDAARSALTAYAGILATHGASPANVLKLNKALTKVFARMRTRCSYSGFSGVISDRGEWMPYVGMALATIGLVVGFGTLYKSWD